MHYIELYNKTLKIKQNFVPFKMLVGGNSNNHSFHNHEDNNIGPELCKTYACFIILYLEQQFYVYHHPKSRCGITRGKREHEICNLHCEIQKRRKMEVNG